MPFWKRTWKGASKAFLVCKLIQTDLFRIKDRNYAKITAIRTNKEKNYTSWKSTIRGHFDAVVLNTSVNDAVLSAVNTPQNLPAKQKQVEDLV